MSATRIDGTMADLSGLRLANGAFMEYGRGRIVIFFEAASFSAQLKGAEKRSMDMNNP